MISLVEAAAPVCLFCNGKPKGDSYASLRHPSSEWGYNRCCGITAPLAGGSTDVEVREYVYAALNSRTCNFFN